MVVINTTHKAKTVHAPRAEPAVRRRTPRARIAAAAGVATSRGGGCHSAAAAVARADDVVAPRGGAVAATPGGTGCGAWRRRERTAAAYVLRQLQGATASGSSAVARAAAAVARGGLAAASRGDGLRHTHDGAACRWGWRDRGAREAKGSALRSYSSPAGARRTLPWPRPCRTRRRLGRMSKKDVCEAVATPPEPQTEMRRLGPRGRASERPERGPCVGRGNVGGGGTVAPNVSHEKGGVDMYV